MALRLSSILMGKQLQLDSVFFLVNFLVSASNFISITSPLFSGGVVIVYERKVKLLYGTVPVLLGFFFLVEIFTKRKLHSNDF